MTDDERIYSTWMHLSGLSSYIIPTGHILVPLILWLLKRRESEVIDQQGKEVLNFQITITFYLIFSYILVFVLVGFVFLPVVIILHLVATIIGTVKTYDGQFFRYPVTFRVIR